MTIKAIILILSYSLVSIGVILLPLWVAYAYSKWFSKSIKHKIRFSIICTLLTYGLVVISAFPIIPLESISIFVSPILFTNKHDSIYYIIQFFIEYITPIFSIIVWLTASIMIPIKLKEKWLILTNSQLAPQKVSAENTEIL